MITIGKRYLYNGIEVIVEDGDRLEHVWTVRTVIGDRLIMGVSTSELKQVQR